MGKVSEVKSAGNRAEANTSPGFHLKTREKNMNRGRLGVRARNQRLLTPKMPYLDHSNCPKIKDGRVCLCYNAGYGVGYKRGLKMGLLHYEEIKKEARKT